jgi:hypothetical protein
MGLFMGANKSVQMSKDARNNTMVERRRAQREEMIMKRRGLNFVTEHHEELLTRDTIDNCEKHLDNVAPKVVGILAISSTCDNEAIRRKLIEECVEY